MEDVSQRQHLCAKSAQWQEHLCANFALWQYLRDIGKIHRRECLPLLFSTMFSTKSTSVGTAYLKLSRTYRIFNFSIDR
jgi:hypothetical protein